MLAVLTVTCNGNGGDLLLGGDSDTFVQSRANAIASTKYNGSDTIVDSGGADKIASAREQLSVGFDQGTMS
jgi:hypothetical protein